MPLRKFFYAFYLLILLGSGWLAVPASARSAQDGAAAVILRLEGPLNPVWESYIARGLSLAEEKDAAVLILELNTPGGSIDLMNKLVQQIRSSSLPVIVYVAPNGAMAGSAGTILTLAGHASAMAPETAIGAASPVDAQGEDIGSTMESKVKEILKATARSLAERRGPAAIELANEMIDQARAVSASEALTAGLIDIKAENIADLLDQLDGRTVYMGSQAVVLRTASLEEIQLPISSIELFLQILANPNLVFILLSLGVQALLIELSNPGAWVPGFIAAVCLTLAVYGLGILPVNWFGIIFILLAFVLFILEIKTPTLGGLTAAE
jgi:membrane-bound serine protease (ClpP class)